MIDTEMALKHGFNTLNWFFNPLPWRIRILVHDCLGHPIAGFLWAFGFNRLAYIVHNVSVPMLCKRCDKRFDAEICLLCGDKLL